MSSTAIVPLGTPKGSLIALNGVPHIVSEGDVNVCADCTPIKRNYFDVDGNPVADRCDAVSVELPVTHVCCGNQYCVLVPEGVDVSADHTPLFTEDYANDGTPIPDLADAGAVLAAYTHAPEDCPGGYWDSVGPTPPAGYVYVDVSVVSAEAAIAAAA